LNVIHQREVGSARESTDLIGAILQGRIVILVWVEHLLVLLVLQGQQVLIEEVLMGQAEKVEVIQFRHRTHRQVLAGARTLQ